MATAPLSPPLGAAFSALPGLVRGFAERGPAPSRWAPGEGGDCRHTEIFAPAGEAGGAALALSFALEQARAANTADDQRAWLWVQDKAARRLGGRPYRAGLPESLRHRLVHVSAESAEDALFAIEEGLRCRDLAFVVGEIAGNPRAMGLTASRRFSLAAEKHQVPLWLVRLDARRDLGSARMRWEARAAPSPPPRWNPHAPGPARWRAELFRAHTFQPGEWTLGITDDVLHAQPAAPDHGDLAGEPVGRPLAAG